MALQETPAQVSLTYWVYTEWGGSLAQCPETSLKTDPHGAGEGMGGHLYVHSLSVLGRGEGARGALGDVLVGLTFWGPGRRPRPPEDERSFSEEGGAAVGGAWLASPRPDPEGFSPCPDKDKGPFCGWRTQNWLWLSL